MSRHEHIFCLQVALVYGQMNEPPGARARVALTGLTVAEYFRDQEGQDVLLFIDNIFRFTQAGSEVITDQYLPHQCLPLADKFYILSSFRCLPCWVVSPLLWVISQLWLLTWVPCKKELPPQRKAQSHLYRFVPEFKNSFTLFFNYPFDWV